MAIRPHPTKSKKEPGKHWHLDVYIDGEREFISFSGTYEQAVEMERDIRQKPAENEPGLAPKIKNLILPFLDYYKGESAPRTVKDASSTLKGPIINTFGNLQPGALNVNLFDLYKSQRLEAGLKKRTVNKELSYFSALLKWAEARGHCRTLQFKIPRFSHKSTEAPIVKPFTPRQVTAMYETIDSEYKLIFLLMADLGLRREEAMKVSAEDIDEHNRVIKVVGKGDKTRHLPFTSKRLDIELEKALQKVHSGPLSINPKTGNKYYSIRKALIRAAEKAKIKREVNHHVFRHSFATNAAERGVSPHALQSLLGHASIVTTNKIYVHIRQDFVRDEVEKLRG